MSTNKDFINDVANAYDKTLGDTRYVDYLRQQQDSTATRKLQQKLGTIREQAEAPKSDNNIFKNK